MKTDIGISDKNRNSVVKILTTLLANEHVLYTKTRKFHWNVEGENFSALHKFFEEQYTEIAETIDEVAERIRALGSYSIGSMKEFLEVATLEEHTNLKLTSAKDMVKELLRSHEFIIKSIRDSLTEVSEKYSDEGTTDFLTGIMSAHEKQAWMLRASLN